MIIFIKQNKEHGLETALVLHSLCLALARCRRILFSHFYLKETQASKVPIAYSLGLSWKND